MTHKAVGFQNQIVSSIVDLGLHDLEALNPGEPNMAHNFAREEVF